MDGLKESHITKNIMNIWEINEGKQLIKIANQIILM